MREREDALSSSASTYGRTTFFSLVLSKETREKRIVMAYAVRISPRDHDGGTGGGAGDESNAKLALDKIGGAYLACREDASKMHLHIVVWTDWKPAKVRNTFTNTMGKTGNGVISIKVAPTAEGAARYACKGDKAHPERRGNPPEVVWLYGKTQADVDRYHEQYWSQSNEIKSTKGLTFTTQVEHYMKQNQLEFTPASVTNAVLKMAIDKKSQINEYYLAGVAKALLAKNNRTYRVHLRNSLLAKVTLQDAYPSQDDPPPSAQDDAEDFLD